MGFPVKPNQQKLGSASQGKPVNPQHEDAKGHKPNVQKPTSHGQPAPKHPGHPPFNKGKGS